jgi:vacuolar-type H+-ATPase subunit I/STV1
MMTGDPLEEDDFRARMYGNQDEDDDAEDAKPGDVSAPAKPTGILSMPALTAMVRTLTKTIEDQDRRIKRLEGRLRQVDRATQRMGRAVNDLDVEVGNKIDRRGE